MDINNHLVKRFRVKFIALILILLALIISSSWALLNIQKTHISDSALINVAGEQRALIQKVNHLFLISLSEKTKEEAFIEMEENIKYFNNNLQKLKASKKTSLSEIIQKIYFSKESNIEEVSLALFTELRKVLLINDDSIVFKDIEHSIQNLYQALDRNVSALEQNASQGIKEIVSLQLLQVVLSVGVVLAIIALIYYPMEKQLNRDIHILREQLVNLTSVMDSAPAATVAIDTNNKITYFSKRSEKLWQCKATDVLGKDVDILIPTALKAHHAGYIEAHRNNGVDKIIGASREIVLETMLGEKRDCILYIAKLGSLDKQSNAYTAFIRDVTIEKQQTEELMQAEKEAMLNAKLATIGQMAAVIAHEINNPLAIISASLELLERKLADKNYSIDEINKRLAQISNSAERIDKIVKGVKSTSKIDPDATYVDSQPINIIDVCKQTIMMLQELNHSAGVKIVFTPPSHQVYAIAESIGLQQALINVINNARDALEENVDKTVNIEIEDSPLNCKIKIKDNGPGIEQKHLNKIFDPFFTTKRATNGTGLGLSFIKKLLSNMGANIEVSSEIGIGTEFTLTFCKTAN